MWGLFDNFRDEIQTGFHSGLDRAVADSRGNRLEQLALIGFRHHIFTQALYHILRVRHGRDASGIHRLHLLDQPKNAGELVQGDFNFRVTDFNTREMRNAFNIGVQLVRKTSLL